MQTKTVVCPNCGAAATNLKNCEYCGSLLVRFIDNNILLDESKYGHKAIVFNGLKEALKRNLEEQERTYGRNHIHTNISHTFSGVELDVTNPIAQTEVQFPNVYFEGAKSTLKVTPTYQNLTDEQSLVICIRFYEITDVSEMFFVQDPNGEFAAFNEHNSMLHNQFKKLDIYKLFTLQTDTLVICNYFGLGLKCGNVSQYYLDFGQDVEGAADIITQFLKNMAEIDSSETCDLTYEQISLTPEEYTEIVSKSLQKSQLARFAFIIMFLLVIGLCIYGILNQVYTGGSWIGIIVGIACLIFYLKKSAM